MTHRWRKVDSNLYGAFPVKWLFSIYCRVFVRSGKGRSSSRRLRSGSRSARKGSRDRNASGAWRLAALARLVFRSALTPEHAEGRWGGDGPFFEALRLIAPAIRLRDDRRGARHWVRIAHRKLVSGRSVWILTMMQSCASAAKLRGGGPILAVGIGAMSVAGTRHLGSSIGSPH